ncbi:Uncharacterised protein [Legionella wadsworthii]|uniref:Uncharacterized protein n=1 Tax=Legionella wadsworthii TaxID=28088 RepID=A0A378LN34_9GAMM|nr:hypothetical protein [Legionella wadsworthii]STY28336.1 Uncharacterised protein [Legionella wadsworthii]
MKCSAKVAIVLIPICFFSLSTVHAMQFNIHGKEAKKLYNELTGPKVQEEGAAGHLYRKGKSILCRYTNADMSKNGKEVPKKSAYRYACSIHFNHNGFASPGHNPQ